MILATGFQGEGWSLFCLRTSAEDKSQRMLNALLPGTEVPVHRHPMSNENVICLCGKLVEVLYEEGEITQEGELVLSLACPEALEGKETPMCKNTLRETARYTLDPSAGAYGCIVPAGVWYFDKLSIDAR